MIILFSCVVVLGLFAINIMHRVDKRGIARGRGRRPSFHSCLTPSQLDRNPTVLSYPEKEYSDQQTQSDQAFCSRDPFGFKKYPKPVDSESEIWGEPFEPSQSRRVEFRDPSPAPSQVVSVSIPRFYEKNVFY